MAGATAAKEEGGDATTGADPEEAAAAAAEAKAAKAARDKLLKEARNAPKVIDKIERALAVIDEDLKRSTLRMMARGRMWGRRRDSEGTRRKGGQAGAVLRRVGTIGGGDGGGGGDTRRRGRASVRSARENDTRRASSNGKFPEV